MRTGPRAVISNATGMAWESLGIGDGQFWTYMAIFGVTYLIPNPLDPHEFTAAISHKISYYLRY